MSNMLRKADMVKVLTEANVQFDPEATVNQLRPLYDEVIYRLQTNARSAAETEANSEKQNQSIIIDMDNNDDADVVASEIQRQQQKQMQEQQHQYVMQQQQQQYHMQQIANQNQVNPIVAVNQQPPQMNIVDEAELDRQLAIARKQLELMQLREQLKRLDLRRFNFNAFDGMVNKFTGDDAYEIKKWFEDMERAFALFDCSDSDKLMAAHRAIQGTAQTFLRSKQVLSYAELKQLLLTEFDRKWTAREVYDQLKQRKRQTDESLRRYVAVMEEIASRADIAEMDLIDCIIKGLQDKSGNIQLLLSARSLKDFKEVLKRYENQTEEDNREAIRNGAIQKRGSTAAMTNSSTGAKNAIDMSTIRCFNCGEFGHFNSKCTRERRPKDSCFICHQIGHMRQNCPQRRTINPMGQAAAPVVPPAAHLLQNQQVLTAAAAAVHQQPLSSIANVTEAKVA